ncbi:hypothetical protein D910_12152 [Dendroctonus ponderosae]|uniref:Protein phosphatase methylesterase 1 n=1 Tax=Dendroctonus ponderosae TaxID=77166 RepID=U4ULE7_DENPD|nr:hypothetical protein D910_12152 [Dendroctonus ponderosae]
MVRYFMVAATMDVINVANAIAPAGQSSIVLVGHSMGGAIAVNASYQIQSLVGLCVIDVVEGTALDALSSMQSILRGRPTHFKSIPHAIQWCYKGGQCHNLEAARVSMPGQIVNVQSGAMACDEWNLFENMNVPDMPHSAESSFRSSNFTIREGVEEVADHDVCGKPPLAEEKTFKVPTTSTGKGDEGSGYTWRIDLSKTETYWKHWFQGLSEKFLGTNVPRILMLANISGLDTKLTVGQMQGKFQLQVLAKTGHAVHEDQPHQVAEILSIYLVKQKCATTKAGFVMPLHPNVCC